MIISRTQRSTSQEKNWWRAHQNIFLTQTVYQRRAVDSNRTCLISSALLASVQCCSKLGIKGKVIGTQTQVFLIQHILTLTTHGSFRIFFCLFHSPTWGSSRQDASLEASVAPPCRHHRLQTPRFNHLVSLLYGMSMQQYSFPSLSHFQRRCSPHNAPFIFTVLSSSHRN